MRPVLRAATGAERSAGDWYERSVRSAPAIDREEEARCVAALEAHRGVLARDVLGSPIGLAYLGELAAALASRRVDVRSLVETEADVRVEDARAACLLRLGRIEGLADRVPCRPLKSRARDELHDEIRELVLRRAHVDAVVARMEAARPATTRALARLRVAADGAAQARARLIESHLRLVASLARRYIGNGLELPDLVQEGTFGLMRAADRFDARHQATFGTYAGWWVRQTIGRALANRARPVRLPLSVGDGVRRLRKHRQHLTLEQGRTPSSAEIAAVAQLSVARVEDLARIEHELCRPMLSFDEPPTDDPDGRAPADLLADESRPGPEDATVARRLEQHAFDALDALEPREQRVMRLRYGIGEDKEHTLEDIGQEFGVTRQRILQIATKALSKLRTSQHAGPLRSFWRA